VDIQFLPSSFGGLSGQCLAGLLVNGRVAVDAGSVGLHGTVADQARISDVLLTHSHLDHIATLPVLVDNAYQAGPGCVTVHGLPETLAALRGDVFNDRLWPDFVALSESMPSFLRLAAVAPGVPFAAGGLTATALPVDHPVPTVAYLIEQPGGAAVGYVTDTRSADVVRELVRLAPALRAVFLEASFPTRLAALAATTGHLTAAQFLAAARAAPPGVRVLAVHVKPRYYAEVVAEIAAAALPHAGVAEAGRTYSFR
jgi:ribonuclease BN (tRNA processing enzyme)